MSESESQPEAGQLRGIDLVKKVLEDARARSGSTRAVAQFGGSSRAQAPVPRRRSARRSWSGPRPDERDPQLFGQLAGSIAKRRGWTERVSSGTVLGRWEAVVGSDIASHATPRALEHGVLTVQAESTAWATQLRYMQGQILARIAAAVGDGVVTKLKILAPAAPSWRKGELHIRGRGPRDTYG
ncbi:DUF721 family protein [Hoyosella sp. YIM 151337]|uniref:DUF721 family protein n=1 Tax=Hoyosella sp. YIM 151337 TaxID=2992742 RepID=UPI002236451A|nr:DUF721 family protein [Hoyosella sp. YIM 151337]MCW4354786.1 DUF721 family protein [Hoyosella sp. YIM 151337]